ncbi:MAG: diguanylate cyclase [Alphaproteobacteria bacterium]
MAEHWQSLVGNLAVVALVISAWLHGQSIFAGRPRWTRNLAFGIVMGVGTVASMLLGIQIDGSLFDLRSSLLATAAFFGGPIAGAVAATIAIGYRAVLVGGPNAVAGISAIAVATLIGVAVSIITGRRVKALTGIGILALAVACGQIGVSLMLRSGTIGGLSPLSVPIALMNAMATAISAFFIMHNRVLERERNLLRAAFIESPDLQYVKLPNSRFAAVNMEAARHNGFATPDAMIGKSDFDLNTPARAEALMLAEQKIFETGVPLIDFEELVVARSGAELWYSTSKVALHDADGEIIGIAGVTRDITAAKQLRTEVADSRNQLGYVLSELSDGVAMYDANSVLVYCNDQYRRLFPRSGPFRVPGTSHREILNAVARTGEQVDGPDGDIEAWIQRRTATLKVAGDQDVQLWDGTWLHVRTRPTAEGAALLMVSNITKIKTAEAALLSMTEQLQLLATTDGLTGLFNRRAFDQALDIEVARHRRTKLTLSLLMIDVDRFKRYNDIYGHPAGDAALKSVAQCLRTSLKRPGDIVARYGGEEFVVILPATDEDGAFFIADEFRENLHGLAMPHEAGEKGIVTASVGIAVFTENDDQMTAAELLRRADEALYNAKGAGRDRVTGWRARHEIPLRQISV